MHLVLYGQRHALLHLRWRGTRHRGGDVQHWNQNLRLLFAGDDCDREDSKGQRCGNKERRQLGVEKGVSKASGNAKFLLGGFWLHGWTLMRLPARSRSEGALTSLSPEEMPDRTSMRSEERRV